MISDDSVGQADAASSGKGLVKGFATIDHVALINVEGTGMVRPMQPHHCISWPVVHHYKKYYHGKLNRSALDKKHTCRLAWY